MRKNQIFLMIIIVFFQSCLQKSASKRSTVSVAKSTSTSSNTSSTTGTNSSEENLYWFTTEKLDHTVVLPTNFQSSLFLRGNSLNSYLTDEENFNSTYCTVFTFSLGTSSPIKTLRIRSIPIVFTNFSLKTSERLLRLDANSMDELPNNLNCVENDGADTTIAYKIDSVCPNCTVPISSTQVSIFAMGDSSQNLPLETEHLVLTLGPSSLSNDIPSSTCNKNNCIKKGYDCCSTEGECIKDGQTKPEALTHPDYIQAMNDITQNKASFSHYPHLFYSCGDQKIPDGLDPEKPNNEELAKAELTRLIDYYFCQQGELLSPKDYTNCLTTQDIVAYNKVKDQVWDMCQCSTLGDPPPLDPQNTCPAYLLTAKDFQGKKLSNLSKGADLAKIKMVECSTLDDSIDQAPFQDLKIDLWGRTIPHRYFKNIDGSSVDDITTLDSSVSENLQEGDSFSYLDVVTNSQPEQSNFSMNAILGPMNIDLSQSYPAKAIKIKRGLVYAISVVDGTYTPCPNCARDAWSSALSAFPPTKNGTGLQGLGYPTARNDVGTNLSLANYEDTKFGRACWVPPTMIPFSHDVASSSQDQRINRLTTQAAFFVNGYQRDWYGFNYGALIGSFNGVNWFAIGNNRRIQASSDTLYLAINAPYGDLAINAPLTVQVIQDTGFSQIPKYDWDPDPKLSSNSPLVNQGASCQKFHQCSTDADCISTLGWEYACANIGGLKTLWPTFNNTDENSNSSVAMSLSRIILGGVSPNSSNNRCVYRGAGAACSIDPSLLPANLRPVYTCAPNFYCASINSSEFNSKINRSSNELASIIYGHGAPRLGRPLNYIGASESLNSIIIGNIKANALAQSIAEDNIGLCQPGRSLNYSSPGKPNDNHQQKDNAKRTDYVNQIAGCNSQKIGGASVAMTRLHSCPVLDPKTGNYIYPDLVMEYEATHQALMIAQNSCGSESLNADLLSPFKLIELEILVNLNSFELPGIVSDACYRKAGSICHSDLDCSPNYLHEEKAFIYDESYFGNTKAEQQYWQESLICGQAYTPPMPNSADKGDIGILNDYNLKDNRCCRQVGKSLTIYTQGDFATKDDNPNLDTSVAGFSINGPDKLGRYSRYSILDNLVTAEPALNSKPTRVQALISVDDSNNLTARPKRSQWKTINDVGEKTCCGGGFIRKFADGGHDWTQGSKLDFDISGLACINFRSELYDENATRTNSINYQNEKMYMCVDPKNNGCVQYNIEKTNDPNGEVPPKQIANFKVSAAVKGSELYCDNSGNNCKIRIHSVSQSDPDNESTKWLHDLAPYNPLVYIPSGTIGPKFVDNEIPVFSNSIHLILMMHLPSYIDGIDKLKNIYISHKNLSSDHYADVQSDWSYTLPRMNSGSDECLNSDPTSYLPSGAVSSKSDDVEGWCYYSNTGTLLIKRHECRVGALDSACLTDSYFTTDTAFSNTRGFNQLDDKKIDQFQAGVILEFEPLAAGNDLADGKKGSTPGNELYYLKRLELLQLLGIPQIYLKPLYCNSDKDKLVGSLFKNISTRSDVLARSALTPQDGEIISQSFALPPPSFSSSEFSCCKPLGFLTSSPISECCSGFGVSVNENKYECAIPARSDLHLYFNQFVSNEGTQAHISEFMRLNDSDFDLVTGFPKGDTATFNKIKALGEKYCRASPLVSAQITVKTGAAFANYDTNRIGPSYDQGENIPPYGILYGINDIQSSKVKASSAKTSGKSVVGEKGGQAYSNGYLFNHHLYCVYE